MTLIPIRILLVSDDVTIAVLVREWLEQVAPARYVLDWAATSEEAARRIDGEEHQAYLIDYDLGSGSGLDLLQQIRSAARATGRDVDRADAPDVDAGALERGASDYLSKQHLSPGVLERSIRYAIERKRTEALERERSRLEEATNALERVIGVVAHELRTPLTSMRLLAEFALLDGSGDAAKGREALEKIAAEAVRMSGFVTNLLEASRLDSGLAKWNWSRFDLYELCSTTMDVFRAQVDERVVTLKCVCPFERIQVRGDEDAIRRLIVNLLSNAGKHTARGTITLTCGFKEGEGGRRALIEVADTGSGIPRHVLDRLGVPFALNSGVVGMGHVQGTGLGLAICREIAAAHGGMLVCTSQEGMGSTIAFEFRQDLDGPLRGAGGLHIVREAA